MTRLILSFVLLATLLGCQHASSHIWRASEDNGDKPGIGFELKKEGAKITGVAFILDPNFPHDFTHGLKHDMLLLQRSPQEIQFLVPWSEKTKETLVFQFPEQDWPAAFQAMVTQISRTEKFASRAYNFKATK